MSHLICCTAQSASGSLKANKPPPTLYETPMVPPSAQHLSIVRCSMSMDGNPHQVKFTLLFPGFQQNTLKTCCISVSPYIWRTQEEIFISLLFTFFFLSPFIELCNMHSMHKTSPDAPGNHNRYLHKRHWRGARHRSLTKRWLPFRATRTHSLGNSSKGKSPKHVLHINRSYIHGQSRVSEWNSFMCLWLISQANTFTSFIIKSWLSHSCSLCFFLHFNIWNA